MSNGLIDVTLAYVHLSGNMGVFVVVEHEVLHGTFRNHGLGRVIRDDVVGVDRHEFTISGRVGIKETRVIRWNHGHCAIENIKCWNDTIGRYTP